MKDIINSEYFQTRYNLSKVVNPKVHFIDRHGVLENAVMSPIFQKHANYFLREIHRLSQFDILYYKLSWHDTMSAHSWRPLMTFLSNMLHIMPRRSPEYDLKVLEENGNDIFLNLMTFRIKMFFYKYLFLLVGF